MYVPKKYTEEELDVLAVPISYRNACADYMADFMKCGMLMDQTHYFNQWDNYIKHCLVYRIAHLECLNTRAANLAGFSQFTIGNAV